jgi:hypothetical protein
MLMRVIHGTSHLPAAAILKIKRELEDLVDTTSGDVYGDYRGV